MRDFSPLGLKYLLLFIAARNESNNTYLLFITTGGEEWGAGGDIRVHKIAVARTVGICNQGTPDQLTCLVGLAPCHCLELGQATWILHRKILLEDRSEVTAQPDEGNTDSILHTLNST